MKINTILALVATSGLIIACAQIPTAQASLSSGDKLLLASSNESHEDAKEKILREGGYDDIKGNSGESCRRICVVEPNAISCLQALEDEDCTKRAEDARKKLGLPQREHNPLPMPMGDIQTASRTSGIIN
jgi:hypothetical protein